MNAHEIEGNWKQIKGHVQEQWGRLTDDDVDRIEGRRQALIGRIQERYGKDLATAEKEVDAWMEALDERLAGK